MRIHIRQIRSGGIELEEEFPVESIGVTEEDDVHFISPINVKAFVTLVDSVILVKMEVKSRYESFCSRCSKDIQQDWTANFDLDFEYDGTSEFVEIGEDVRQEIILNLPVHVLCKEDCKGLCFGCRVDLNNEECKCSM